MRLKPRSAALAAFALSLPLIVSPSNAPAQDAAKPLGRAMLVLDASGSMWGQIDGVNKIVIARETIADLVGNWDPKLSLGLTAYGHRRKGDCGDIQVLLQPGAAPVGEIAARVNALNPKGKTPLSDAVVTAARALDHTNQPATVILVSDGLETCNADPCAVARDLAKTGVEFVTHVIGFDIKPEERANLECMATETGGSYHDANNAAELQTALTAVTTTAVKSVSADRLVGVLTAGGAPYKNAFLRWRVFPAAADGTRAGPMVAETIDSRLRLEVPPGRYLATAQVDAARADAVVEVIEGEPKTHEVPLGFATVRADYTLAKDKPAETGDARWAVFETDANGVAVSPAAWATVAPRATYAVNAGTHIVTVEAGGASAHRPVTLEPGETKAVTVSLGVGTVRLQPRVVDGGAAFTGEARWQLWIRNPPGSENKWTRGPAEVGRAAVFRAPSGEHSIEITIGGTYHKFERPVFEAGVTIDHPFSLDLGFAQVRVRPKAGADPVREFRTNFYQRKPDGSLGRKLTTVLYPGNKWAFAAGEYVAEAEVGFNDVRRAPFTVVAGETAQVDVILEK